VAADPIIKSDVYEVMASIKAVEGQPLPASENDYLNFNSVKPRQCRFCKNEEATFKNQSHTFPAGLGNRWHISWDECDKCNTHFATSDGHLCSALGIVLTYCGIKGRKGVRSTGRVNGRHIVGHTEFDGNETVSIVLLDKAIGVEPTFSPNFPRIYTSNIDEKYIPRLAFKALMKIGMAIMPRAELANFQKLSAWILDSEDGLDFPFLKVAIAFDEIVNAPKAWSAILLRRKQQDAQDPYCKLVFTLGPICILADLMPDSLDDNIGLQRLQNETAKFDFDFTLKDGSSANLSFKNYTALDWSSALRVATPIKAMHHNFDANAKLISITPEFR
jgi:hypothetical protein